MKNLPLFIPLLFGLTVILGVFLFYEATRRSKTFLAILSGWIIFQTCVSLTGFYTVTDTFPPRFPLLVLPTLVMMLVLFTTSRGKAFIDSLDLKYLTFFSVIRLPLELLLFALFVEKAIPQSMTFEGHNFDIFSGLTAPLLNYFVFVKQRLNRTLLLAWNFICLGLLLNVVVDALLSVPGPLQRLAFDQPNIAILHFPFVLLPSVLVPLVLFSHLAAIRKLLRGA